MDCYEYVITTANGQDWPPVRPDVLCLPATWQQTTGVGDVCYLLDTATVRASWEMQGTWGVIITGPIREADAETAAATLTEALTRATGQHACCTRTA